MGKSTKVAKKHKRIENDFEQIAPMLDNNQEQQGMNNEQWKERLLKINGNVVKLKHKPLQEMNAGTHEYYFEPEELILEKSLKLKPDKTEGEVFSYTNNANLHGNTDESVRYLSMGGSVDVEIPGLEKQTINLQSTCIVMPKGEKGEVFLLFRDPVVSELADDKRYKLELNNGRYVKSAADNNGTMYFQGSNLYYKDNPVAENVWLEWDQKGLHMDKPGDLILEQDKLDEDAWKGFDREEELLLSFEEEGPMIMSQGSEEEEISYKTLDGMAEVLDPEYDPDKDIATGNLALYDFFMRYISPKEKLILGKNVKVGDKKIEGVTVTFSGEDNDLLNVEQKKEHKLELEILPEGEFKGVTANVPLVLENIGIKDSRLVIGNARVDIRAGGELNNETEKLKKLFDCKISGSIAYSSSSVKSTEEGIEITEGGISLGSLKVEDFLGFLSGEGDYPKGFVTVTSKKEKEADTSNLFKFGEHNLSEGMDISLPPPVDFLDLKLALSPSADIGGEIGGTISRGESFGNPWKQGDMLAFSDGHFNLKGNASITGTIGLIVKAVVASAGLALNAGLNASLDANLKAGTSFAYQESEKKLQQSENLTFDGDVTATLGGTIAFEGDVKLLFWKMQLFELKKEKEDIVTTGIAFSGSKDKNQKGLTKGWAVKDGKAFFKALSKESIKQIGVKPTELQREKEIDAILKDAGKETENAWAALAELKRSGGKGVGILLEEEEKAKLAPQIEEKKKEAKKNIKKYKEALEKEKDRLAGVIKRAKEEVNAEKERVKEIMREADLPDEFRQKALWGGFKEENYKDVSPEMTSIDFIIYKVLGEGSEQNMEMIRSRNRSEVAAWQTLGPLARSRREEALYHEETSFGEAYNEGGIAENRKDASYYKMLQKKVADLRTEEGEKKEEIIKKNRNKIQDLKGFGIMWQSELKENKVKENKRKSVEKNIDKKINQINLLKEKNTKLESEMKQSLLEELPEKYRAIIEENPSLTIKELLQIAVTDQYNNKKIGASAEEKEQLLERCFHTKFMSKGLLIGDGAKDASDAWMKEMNDILRDRLKNKEDILKKNGVKLTRDEKRLTSENVTLKGLIQQASREKTFELIASREAKIAEKQKSLKKAEAEEIRLEERSSKIEKILQDCEQKLMALKENAMEALTDKAFDAKKATTAIKIYTEDYLGKIKVESDEGKKLKK